MNFGRTSLQEKSQIYKNFRKQLCVCAQTIAREDYPYNWPGIMDQIVQTLSTDSAANSWLASLLVLHQVSSAIQIMQLHRTFDGDAHASIQIQSRKIQKFELF